MELSFPAVLMPSAEQALICELNNCAANRKRSTDVSEKICCTTRKFDRTMMFVQSSDTFAKKAPKPNLFRADRIKSKNNLRQVLVSL